MSTMKTKTGGVWEPWAGGGPPAPLTLEASVVNSVTILTPAGGAFTDIVIDEVSGPIAAYAASYAFMGLPVENILPAPSALGSYGTYALAGTRIKEFTCTRIDNAGELAIGAGCFAECALLERILFSEPMVLGRLNLAASAFLNCVNLEYIESPGKTHRVTGISSSLFSGCIKFNGQFEHHSLTSISIGASAFYGCEAIVCPISSTQPVTVINANAFRGCIGLEDFTVLFSSGAFTAALSADIFNGCDASQITLDMRNRSVMVSYSANAFRGVVTTDGPVTIIVPSSLLSTYTGNASWAAEVSAGRVQFVGV